MILKNLIVSGKRKCAVAKVAIREGTGKIKLNKKPLSSFPELKRLEILEPLIIAREVLGKSEFDISVNVKGGGLSSQIEAARLAIARAIVEFVSQSSKEKGEDLKRTFLTYDRNLLIADTRRREPYKPGDSKARARRQTSYR